MLDRPPSVDLQDESRITQRRRPQGVKNPKRLNVSKLKSELVQQELAEELERNLQSHDLDPDTDVETEWARISDTIYATASAVVGPSTREHQDWFDENNSRIKTLLEEKRRLYRALLNDPSFSLKKNAFNSAKRTAQFELRRQKTVDFQTENRC